MNIEKLEIKQIEDLFPLTNGSKIKSYKLKRLTEPGQNLGSLMLSVDISIKTSNGPENIHAVAKLPPPNEFIQEIFNTQVTFRNEIGFFKNVIPLLQNFQREHGKENVIDYAAKYYGSRLNLNNDDTIVDADAALILENLKVSGYDTFDRLHEFDLEPAKLVILNLAEFHAVPLALRIQKPDVFQKEIKRYLTPWHLKDDLYELTRQDHVRLINEVVELQPLRERIFQGLDRVKEEPKFSELYATIVHNDVWNNNNMFRFDGDKVVKSKMVDFQILGYGSPTRDVVFFIFSTLKNTVIKNHYEELVKLYYDTLVSILKELRCDVTPFTWEAFLKDIDHEAKYSQFGHLAFMLSPLYAPKGSAPELTDFSPEKFKVSEFTSRHKEKYTFVYKEFAERGWI